LKTSHIPFKLCSNESTETRANFAAKLTKHGFNITSDDIVCPVPAMVDLLKQENLRPHLLVHPGEVKSFLIYYQVKIYVMAGNFNVSLSF